MAFKVRAFQREINMNKFIFDFLFYLYLAYTLYTHYIGLTAYLVGHTM